MEFPGTIGGLARLLGREVRGRRLGRRGLRLLGGLMLGVGRGRSGAGRRRLCRLRIGLRRARAHGCRRLFTDQLAVVVADHHDDELGLLGRYDLARHLRPLVLAAPAVADEPGIGAMLAHDGDVGVLGVGVFEAVSEPVGIGVAHDHDAGGGVGLLLRRTGRARIIRRCLAFVSVRPVATVTVTIAVTLARRIPTGTEPSAERVVVALLLALRPVAPVPELRLCRQHQRHADPDCRYRGQSPELEGCAHRLPTARSPGWRPLRNPAAPVSPRPGR